MQELLMFMYHLTPEQAAGCRKRAPFPVPGAPRKSTRSRCFQYTQILLKNKRENAKRP